MKISYNEMGSFQKRSNHYSFKEMVYWNNNTYGNAYRVSKLKLHSFVMFMCVVIPVVLPVPLGLLVCKFLIKQDYVYRYD